MRLSDEKASENHTFLANMEKAEDTCKRIEELLNLKQATFSG